MFIIAVGGLDDGLTSGIVAGSGHGFQPAFIDYLTASGTDAVGAFFDAQERLIYIRNHLRFALTQTQGQLFVNIHHGVIDRVFYILFGKLESISLILTNVFGVLSELVEKYCFEVSEFLRLHYYPLPLCCCFQAISLIQDLSVFGKGDYSVTALISVKRAAEVVVS
jgi:hypothetical protein